MAAYFAVAVALHAQQLKKQPTPFSVWLDFRALSSATPPQVALPVWFDSLSTTSTPASGSLPALTHYRVQLRHGSTKSTDLQLRLFFDDVANSGITVTGWSETGSHVFQKGPLGEGLGLPTSVSMALPMTGVDYLELAVPGNGSVLRGVFLASLNSTAIRQPIDFPTGISVADAFGNLPAASPKADDFHLLGRVQATLDPGILKLTPGSADAGSWQFNLQSAPLIAVITFEILDADPISPPQMLMNNQPLGPVDIHFPDLADPGYVGVVRALDPNTHFRYTGWLRAQKVISASALQAGSNALVVQLNKASGPAAVRAVEIQLKYKVSDLDFSIPTSAP